MKALSVVFVLMIFQNVALAQLSKEFEDKCHAYVVDVAKASKAEGDFLNSGKREAYEKALASAQSTFPEFSTKIGEEELTTKHFPFPNSKLFITASVFYTDESMASHPQGDYQFNDQSMLVGIMVSSKAQDSALSASTPNASVTEVTYDEYTNIVRSKQYVNVGGRKYLLGIQCDCLSKGKPKK